MKNKIENIMKHITADSYDLELDFKYFSKLLYIIDLNQSQSCIMLTVEINSSFQLGKF